MILEYKKGIELVTADALSRVHEVEKGKLKNKLSESIKKGKREKHVVIVDNAEYWRFDSGEMRCIPPIGDRKELAQETHERLSHRGLESIYYEMKKEYYWPGIKNTIKNVIRKCKICMENNRKKSGGVDFVMTSRRLQKVALDIAEIRGEYILLIIDYFSRMCKMIKIENKKAETICAKFI
jgi:Integrase zinc binding domain